MSDVEDWQAGQMAARDEQLQKALAFEPLFNQALALLRECLSDKYAKIDDLEARILAFIEKVDKERHAQEHRASASES